MVKTDNARDDEEENLNQTKTELRPRNRAVTYTILISHVVALAPRVAHVSGLSHPIQPHATAELRHLKPLIKLRKQ